MSSSFIDQIKLNNYLRKAQAGEILYLNDLIRMMREPLFKYIFSITRDYYLSEDILQEVSVRIFKYLNKYDDKQTPKAWIYKITKNTIFTVLKSKNKEVPFEDEKLHFLIDREQLYVDADLSFVGDALNVLNKVEKEIVSLHIYGGLKHYETAEVLKIPYDKVRSSYRYALQKIKKELGGKYDI